MPVSPDAMMERSGFAQLLCKAQKNCSSYFSQQKGRYIYREKDLRLLPSSDYPPHRYPAKIDSVLLYSPCLFGKKLFPMQDKLVNNKQTHFLKQNFSETITPIDKSCMLLFELRINPVFFLILVFYVGVDHCLGL